MDSYSDSMTLREARTEYFRRHGFDETSYTANWVLLKAGRFRFGFPNTTGRKAVVRRHDLHHVLTGYAANWTGEGEIAAWELASGCRWHYTAWVLNFGAMAIGLCIAPRAVVAAFRKGRREDNLYAREWSENWLDQPLGKMRRELKIER